MTLARRVIACLDVDGARVVKGVRFTGLREVGDPEALAIRYEAEGADEIVFLDVSASVQERESVFDLVQRTARGLFIPLTLGGGLRSVTGIDRALRSGADKVSLNTAAVARPELIGEAAARFGAQCVVLSIDAARDGNGSWRVYVSGGREPTTLDAVAWAREGVARGAGEVLLTSIDRDGTRSGYDHALTAAVSSAVNVPVIASGGAGTAEHVLEILAAGVADAALVAGVLHEELMSVGEIKRLLARHGVPVREMVPC